jgi:hypothetical protein
MARAQPERSRARGKGPYVSDVRPNIILVKVTGGLTTAKTMPDSSSDHSTTQKLQRSLAAQIVDVVLPNGYYVV